ncbi:MAG: serine/threonine protein kinase [Myxococcales bacterium]|nr:serine/threonine protein kinase [Myxococcales bacterium]
MQVGRYEVELLLGEGSIGRVYLARDPMLGRQVALKVLRDDLPLDPDRRRALADRVRNETRAAATLSHPALVTLHDLGEDERAGLFVVQELVRGPTLRERLHEGPLSPSEVAQIARAIGAALTHAHETGLVHRGVRPENVMLPPTGPKLTDFGISQPETRRPAYESPEYVASGVWTAQGDAFAFAATLYEALTGRRAFPGDDPEAVTALVTQTRVTSPRKVLPALRGFIRLDAVFAQAFAKDPRKRFATCEALGAALASELDGPRITFLATPGPARSSLTRSTHRRQNTLVLIAIGVIVALLLLGRFHQATTDRKQPSMQRVVAPSSSMRSSSSTADSATSSASTRSPAPGAAPSAAGSRADP